MIFAGLITNDDANSNFTSEASAETDRLLANDDITICAATTQTVAGPGMYRPNDDYSNQQGETKGIAIIVMYTCILYMSPLMFSYGTN